jgi:iron complex transport system ATP-binding protein
VTTTSETTGIGTTASSTGPDDATGRVRLAAEGVTLAYDDRVVVRDLDLRLVEGSFTAIVGPNGCGKSTLLRALGRLMRPVGGQVLLDGRSIARTSTREVAKVLGLLPQTPIAPEGLTVADLVARGRHPHQSWLRQWSRDDEAAVAESLAWTDMAELADRPVDELSGGQRQRAWISMALAQGTELLLLDEPTTYLDLSHQIDVLELVGRLHSERGRTVVVVLHDLNLAARYAERLVAMKDGRLIAAGRPDEVLTEQLLADVFDLEARVVPDPVAGTPMVVPVRRLR